MKRITLQLEDVNGLVERESELILSDTDVLVMQYPKEMTIEKVSKLFSMVKSGLENGGIVGIPNTLTFKVIKKG